MEDDTSELLNRFADRLGERIASRYADGVVILRDQRTRQLACVNPNALRGRPPTHGILPRDIQRVVLQSFIDMARGDFAGHFQIEYDDAAHQLILRDRAESVAVALPAVRP